MLHRVKKVDLAGVAVDKYAIVIEKTDKGITK
jgi:hypothetical protein